MFLAALVVMGLWSLREYRFPRPRAQAPVPTLPSAFAGSPFSSASPLPLLPSPLPAEPPGQFRGWFSGVIGRSVDLALDEPDIRHMPVSDEQLRVRDAQEADNRPVAVTFVTPRCAFNPGYLSGIDIMIDDFYPGFLFLRDNVVQLAKQQITACTRVARRAHVQYWLNLQAFGPGVTGFGPLDRWRCLSQKEMNGILALAERPDVNGILFWDRRIACRALLPVIDRAIRR